MNNIKNNQKDNKPHKEKGSSGDITLKKEEYEHLLSELKKSSEYLDNLKRLQADFENAKKRLEKDRLDYIKYAKEAVIADLLGIVDNFQRADEAALKTKDFNILHQGVVMILKELRSLFEKNGVKEIPALGEVFDPLKHEAVEYVVSDDFPDNTVVEELQKGYSLNGKIIRHAVVKVSKKKETEDKRQNTEDRNQKAGNGNQATEDNK